MHAKILNQFSRWLRNFIKSCTLIDDWFFKKTHLKCTSLSLLQIIWLCLSIQFAWKLYSLTASLFLNHIWRLMRNAHLKTSACSWRTVYTDFFFWMGYILYVQYIQLIVCMYIYIFIYFYIFVDYIRGEICVSAPVGWHGCAQEIQSNHLYQRGLGC